MWVVTFLCWMGCLINALLLSHGQYDPTAKSLYKYYLLPFLDMCDPDVLAIKYFIAAQVKYDIYCKI